MTRVARVDRSARCRKLCLGCRRQAGPVAELRWVAKANMDKAQEVLAVLDPLEEGVGAQDTRVVGDVVGGCDVTSASATKGSCSTTQRWCSQHSRTNVIYTEEHRTKPEHTLDFWKECVSLFT